MTAVDPLLGWRDEFPILDTCTYLVSHSLGSMPRGVRAELAAFADQWDTMGVQAWHHGWWETGRETGNLLAPILGVARDTITMHQNATVAQAIAASCVPFTPGRNRVVLQDLDFPTNHYLFEGLRKQGAEIVYVPSDNRVAAPIDRLVDAIDAENEEAIARSPWDAPEIDGNVYLPGATNLKPGDKVLTSGGLLGVVVSVKDTSQVLPGCRGNASERLTVVSLPSTLRMRLQSVPAMTSTGPVGAPLAWTV